MKIPSAGSPIFLQEANTEDKVEKAASLSQISQTPAAINYQKEAVYFLFAVPDLQEDTLLRNKTKKNVAIRYA